jgi:hypothetical protein
MADYTFTQHFNERIGDDIPITSHEGKWRAHASEYEFVRYGNPIGGIRFARVAEEREIVLQRFYSGGWNAGFPKNISRDFIQHLAKFRAVLDLYENLVKKPVFSKEEIYVRCLREGPAFTEYLKKCRSTSLRYKASETITGCEDEYVHAEYTGYDSIFHERNLIHWDDRDEIDDIKYSFLPPQKELDLEKFRSIFRSFLDHIRVVKEDFDTNIEMIEELGPTASYDPTLLNKKGRTAAPTRLLREVWDKSIRKDDPYLARRSVVLTTPGSTRDALTATPGTLLKIKLITKLARVISERSPYSCNASEELSARRYQRVLGRFAFLHLDFKKYGLTFPRELNNIALQEIGRIAEVDLSDLDLTDFFVDIDGTVFRTECGTALGWLDCLSMHCVTALLLYLQRETSVTFDHVGFNDDFELSFWDCGDYRTVLNLTRELLFNLFDEWNIPLSADKIYGSRSSVFLERYFFFEDEYGLDMTKRQLTLTAYASSLVSTFPWEAKMYYDIAYSQMGFEYAKERCIETCPVEFCTDEAVMPIEAGGWAWDEDPNLNYWLRECDSRYALLGSLLRDWEAPKYSTPFKKGNYEQIREESYQRTWRATTAEFYRHTVANPGCLADLNTEAEASGDLALRWAMGYTGRRPGLTDAVERFVFRDIHASADESVT